jgi:hypothetical protein
MAASHALRALGVVVTLAASAWAAPESQQGCSVAHLDLDAMRELMAERMGLEAAGLLEAYVGAFTGVDTCSILKFGNRMLESSMYMIDSNQALPVESYFAHPGDDPATWRPHQLLVTYAGYCFEAMNIACLVALLRASGRAAKSALGPDGDCYHVRLFARLFQGSSELSKNVLGFLNEETYPPVIRELRAIADESKGGWRDAALYALGQALVNVDDAEGALSVYRELFHLDGASGQDGAPATSSFPPKDDTILLVTVATSPRPTLGELLISAVASDPSLTLGVPGSGALFQTVCLGEDFRDLTIKVTCMIPWLQGQDPHQLVLFTDAYDSLVFPSISSAASVFRSLKAPIVFASEIHPSPDLGLDIVYEALEPTVERIHRERHGGDDGVHRGPFRRLNSGQMMGSAGDLLHAFESVMRYHDGEAACAAFNDQRLFTRYYLENPHKVALDTRAELFFCLEALPGDWNAQLTPAGQIVSPTTETAPAIAHGNGDGGKMRLATILRHILGEQALVPALRLLPPQVARQVLSEVGIEVGLKTSQMRSLASALYGAAIAAAVSPRDTKVLAAEARWLQFT